MQLYRHVWKTARWPIEYLRKTADIYHIDPQKIGLWGESAGAHIACMVGSNYNNKKMMPVQGIVPFYVHLI